MGVKVIASTDFGQLFMGRHCTTSISQEEGCPVVWDTAAVSLLTPRISCEPRVVHSLTGEPKVDSSDFM